MEPSTTNDLETITNGRWQWKSNPDPWSKSEPAQWESYSLEQNYLIEKAYYANQKEVDLGDYLVYPLGMLQRKKGGAQAQRPIRRIDWVEHEETNDRSSRYFETELPKTLNKIFGSLEDFLSFFGRRNMEILEFQRQFNEFEQSKDMGSLKKKIIPLLITCLEKELLSEILKQLQDPSLSALKKRALLSKKERHESLISLFQKDFTNVEEFYGNILKSYTMNTALYANLNRYLRNESWLEIDNLLPYLYCLCKAFFSIKSNSSPKENSIFLYRGTALDEAALMSYFIKKNERYFSWYSVTSTTRNLKIAQEFMFRSVNIKEKKTPVMFIIEIPMTEEDLKWIDIQQYSAIPTEDEVILAPGSVFEFVEISSDQDKSFTTIKLKLKGEVRSLAHGGMMMQGALQSQMMTEKTSRIMCLEGEEFDEALMSLCGNKLVEDIEFSLCTFDKKSLGKMFDALKTLEKVKRLKFIACMYQDNGEIAIEELKEGERCEITKIEVIEANDFFQRLWKGKQEEYWASLKELDLDFRSKRNVTDEELNCAVSQRIKFLPQLTSLSINFEECKQITDKGIETLAKELGSLTQLTDLSLNCLEITDEGVKNLGKSLNSLTQLKHLNIKLASSEDITEEGVRNLIKSLDPQLKNFNFKLSSSEDATDEGIKNFAKNLDSLSQLTHFSFRFGWAKQTNSLPELLSFLTQLTHLTLDFSLCLEMAKEEMIFLAKGLGSVTKLTHLDLNFARCQRIAEEEMSYLAEGLSSVNKLERLNVNFGNCEKITDEGVNSLAKGFEMLTALTHLEVNFEGCELITDNGVESLAQRLNTQLTSLNVNLTWCDKITDEGMNSLAQGINALAQLTDLNLDFKMCKNITEEGMKTLAKVISSRTQLTHLNLSFEKCEQITSEGVSILMSQGVKNLTQLISLALDFDDCEKITDQDLHTQAEKWLPLKSLIVKNQRVQSIDSPPKKQPFRSSGIRLVREISHEALPFIIAPIEYEPSEQTEKFITQDLIDELSYKEGENQVVSTLKISEMVSEVLHLNSLTLNFKKFKKIITDDVVHNFSSQVLRNLPQLGSLSLAFHKCKKMTDEGMHALALYGLKPLTNLTYLKLDFYDCKRITDKGVIDLAREGLKHLSQLKSLALNFSWCFKVSDEGLIGLALHGLKYLSQLEAFSLIPNEFTDKAANILVSQGLQCLAELKFLCLLFSCTDITDKGLNNFVLRIVKNLPRLTFVDLHFFGCKNVSDLTVQNIIKVLHYFGFTKEVESNTLPDWGYM